MKKVFAIACVTLSLTACHYGQEDAQKTLDANEQYKSEKAEFSTNRGNEAPAPAAEANVSGPDASAPTAAEGQTPPDSTSAPAPAQHTK